MPGMTVTADSSHVNGSDSEAKRGISVLQISRYVWDNNIVSV
jgi:hypothetical protein